MPQHLLERRVQFELVGAGRRHQHSLLFSVMFSLFPSSLWATRRRFYPLPPPPQLDSAILAYDLALFLNLHFSLSLCLSIYLSPFHSPSDFPSLPRSLSSSPIGFPAAPHGKAGGNFGESTSFYFRSEKGNGKAIESACAAFGSIGFIGNAIACCAHAFRRRRRRLRQQVKLLVIFFVNFRNTREKEHTHTQKKKQGLPRRFRLVPIKCTSLVRKETPTCASVFLSVCLADVAQTKMRLRARREPSNNFSSPAFVAAEACQSFIQFSFTFSSGRQNNDPADSGGSSNSNNQSNSSALSNSTRT